MSQTEMAQTRVSKRLNGNPEGKKRIGKPKILERRVRR